MSRRVGLEPEWSDLSAEFLEDLGLGADAPLLNEPKIFLEKPFLSALLIELEHELKPPASTRALFAIGAAHGLKAAEALGREPTKPQALALPMRLNPILRESAAIGFEGEWPEAHEAHARLSGFAPSLEPICALSAGYTTAWLSKLHDRNLLAVETECVASGGERCRFRALEREVHLGTEPLWPPSAPTKPIPHGQRPLDRELDPGDDAVHVWGPVMVLPFHQPEEAVATVKVLGHDADTLGVRAVVVNLGQRNLAPGRELDLLTEALRTIDHWGAEAILTGLSEKMSRTIEPTLRAPLLTREGLPEAVASAFQIAEAQRYPL